MKKSMLLGLLAVPFASVEAAPVTLDFVESGSHFYESYENNGFTLEVLNKRNPEVADSGNFMIGHYGDGNFGFHNGPSNADFDNDLMLTYEGGSFDFSSINVNGFAYYGGQLDLTGSNGTTFSTTEAGVQNVGILNVTSVLFSLTDMGGFAGVAWDGFNLDTEPMADSGDSEGSGGSDNSDNEPSASSVPEPSTLALLVLGLVGAGFWRKLKIA